MAAAAVLEQRDRVGIGAARDVAAAQLVEVAPDVARRDEAGAQRDDEVTALRECRLAVIDVQLGAHHRVIVDLTMIRLERADEVEVGAGPDQPPLDEGFGGHRRRADHIGLGHRVGQRIDDGRVGDGRDGLRLRPRAVPDEDPLQRRPHRAVSGDEVWRQPPGTDHQQGRHVVASEKPGAERGVGGRLAVRQLGPVDERHRVTGRPAEQQVQRLHRRPSRGRVGGKDGDQLDADRLVGLPRRQGEKGLVGAVRPEHDPARHRRLGAMAVCQRVDQVGVGQEAGDLLAVDDGQVAQVHPAAGREARRPLMRSAAPATSWATSPAAPSGGKRYEGPWACTAATT